MNLSQITADVNFLCGSTSGTYAPVALLRNANIAYQDAARLIWESDSGWKFDDANKTGELIAYKTLTNNQGLYSIPTTALKISQVEVKDNASVWHKLAPLSYQDLDTSPLSFENVGDLPKYYTLDGNDFRLIPPPVSASVTLASGIAMRLSRNVITLSAASASPGFPSNFHRYLSYCTALDFVQDDKLRQFLIGQRDRISNGMVRFFSKRASEFTSTITPASKRKWRMYM